MSKSKISVIADAIKTHTGCGISSYHAARSVMSASRIKDKNEARAAMNTALRSTPLCAWFVYHDGPVIGGYNYGERRAIQIRWGADVIAEFPI